MALQRRRIVIAGGSGRLGRLLANHFLDQGHTPVVLARRPAAVRCESHIWDGVHVGNWIKVLEAADAVINLAGHTLNCRYTPHNQQLILRSRVRSTEVIGEAIASCARPPAIWLNASSTAIYPPCTDVDMDELADPCSPDASAMPRMWAFSMQVTTAWEGALFAAQSPATRRVALRMASVMTPDAGSLFDVLLHLVRLGFGGACGTGEQYVSWIHAADFVRGIDFLLANEAFAGPVNLCSPAPLPNRDFMRYLRHVWCTSYIGLPLPTWAVEAGAALLRTQSELMLRSRRVVPTRLLRSGFEFHFPEWRGAAEDLVRRWRQLYDAA